MATLEDLLPLLRPEVRGCPDFTLEAYILRVLRDFCSRTWVWSEWIEDTYSTGTDRYTLVLQPNKEIAGVRRVWVDGSDMEAAEIDFPGPDDGNDAGTTGTGYIFYPPSDLRFLSTLNDGQQFFVYAALRPSLHATTFPDWIMETYEDGLLAGVKYRLMRQPAQNWSNPELGQYYYRIYQQEIGSAKINELKKYSSVPTRVQPKRFI